LMQFFPKNEPGPQTEFERAIAKLQLTKRKPDPCFFGGALHQKLGMSDVAR